MNQIEKKGKVKKGSVLLTVVVIMMVMVVFLMSTLILATSANRRSFYTYYQTQAQYAAQAALDAVTNAAYSEQDFYNWVKALPATGGDVTLDFSKTDLAMKSSKPVECKIQKVPDTYIWDNDSGIIRQQGAYKITVTASVGTGRNEAQYTAVNYIYENYKNPVVNPLAENKAAWSHVSSITATTTHSGGSGAGSILQSIFTLSPTSSGNNLLCLGPQTSGIQHVPAGRIGYNAYSNQQQKFTNDSVNVGNGLFVGNFYSNDKINFMFQRKNEGAVFYGNFELQNNPYFYAKFPAGEKSTMYKDLPYLYVDGTLKLIVDSNIGYDRSNTNAGCTQVNVYAGALQTGGNALTLRMYGDMYLLDPDLESTLSLSSGTLMSAFAETQVAKSNYGGGYIGGDIISNNKKLDFAKANDGVSIGGDLIMSNPAGTLRLSEANNNGLMVGGTVVCAGNLELNGNLTAYGGVYVMGTIANQNNFKINGTVVHSQADLAAVNAALGLPANIATGTWHTNNSDKYVFVESLGAYGTGTDVISSLTSLKAASPGYSATYGSSVDAAHDYRLFPYCSRPDEIFKEFYRWDLKSSTDAAARAYINTDPLILESRYAGHTWDVKTQVSSDGTFYVPFTTPTNAASNAFIEPLTTRTTTNLPFSYINSMTGFTPYLPSNYTTITPATLNSSLTNSRKTTVNFSSRNKTGADNNIQISNAYVVSQSCEIDVGAFGKDNAGVSCSTDTGPNSKQNTVTIFIDPTQNVVGGVQQPLCIALKGYCNNTYLNIIVNNNMTYADKSAAGVVDYTKGTANSSMTTPTIAGRSDVVFFMEQGFGTNNHMIMTTTGAFYQVLARDIDLISNPLYPGQTGWANNNADSFKYELVPNILVYGQAGVTYEFQNGVFLNAEVLMPDSIYSTPSGDDRSKSKIKYREDQGSIPYERTTEDKNLAGMGTLIVADFKGNNVPMCAYIGDAGRAGSTSTTYNDNTSSNNDAQNRKTVSDGDFFSNDHQGAN